MDDLTLELLGGASIVVSNLFYTKFQTGQNLKEIEELKTKLHQNEKMDSARETEIQVLRTRIDGLEVNISKKIDELSATLNDFTNRMMKKFDDYDKSIQEFYRRNPNL